MRRKTPRWFQRIFVLLLIARLYVLSGSVFAGDISEFRSNEKRIRAFVERMINVTVCLTDDDSSGSGVIVSEDGLILTAAHVLRHPGTTWTVTFSDGRRVKAKALGCDHEHDVALARIIDAGKWPFVEKGHSADLKPGAWCLALGHPDGLSAGRKPPVRLGRLLPASTPVSVAPAFSSAASAPSVSPPPPPPVMVPGLLPQQSTPPLSPLLPTAVAPRLITDASIAPGDSGGPLFDLNGKVIGINTEAGLDARRENGHAPVEFFLDRWNDLLKGKEFGKLSEDGNDSSGIEELKKYAKRRENGSVVLEIAPDKLLDILNKADDGGDSITGDAKYGKSDEKLLSCLADVTARAGRSTVTVLCGGEVVALGTVVRNGLILTKASELNGRVTCGIAGHVQPATIINQNREYDIALLKVDANLTPVEWAANAPAPTGTWLVTPDVDGKPIATGILSNTSRKIARLSHNRAILGVVLDPSQETATILEVSAKGPAHDAGLHQGDVIVAIDGSPTPSASVAMDKLGTHQVGDKVKIDVWRDSKKLQIVATLQSSTRSVSEEEISDIEFISLFSGKLSNRRDNFPSVFTHDMLLASSQCGGPVVGLDGKVVGINIARVDRTATYALPATILPKLIDDMVTGAKSR